MKFDLHMISGLRKSGTSLFKNLLDGHPELFVIPPNEFDFFCYSHHEALTQPKYQRIEDVNKLLQVLARQNFIVRMSASFSGGDSDRDGDSRWAGRRTTFDVESFLSEIEQVRVSSYEEIFSTLFNAMARHCGIDSDAMIGKSFIFKNTLETEFFGLYKKWFPEMKLIYTLRNPYAQFAAQSRGEHLHADKFRYPILAEYVNLMRFEYHFLNYWQAVYPDDIHVVRYEDIVLHSEDAMRGVASFLGIDYRDSLLNPTILGVPWGGNSSADETYKKIDSRPLERWKTVLSQQEIHLITKYFGPKIEEFGYEVIPGKRSLLPNHRTETLRRYVGNKYLQYTPYY